MIFIYTLITFVKIILNGHPIRRLLIGILRKNQLQLMSRISIKEINNNNDF